MLAGAHTNNSWAGPIFNLDNELYPALPPMANEFRENSQEESRTFGVDQRHQGRNFAAVEWRRFPSRIRHLSTRSPVAFWVLCREAGCR